MFAATRHITEEGTKPRQPQDRVTDRQLLGPGSEPQLYDARPPSQRGDCPGTGQKATGQSDGFILHLIRDLHGDGNEPSWVRRFSAAAPQDGLVGRQLPEATLSTRLGRAA